MLDPRPAHGPWIDPPVLPMSEEAAPGFAAGPPWIAHVALKNCRVSQGKPENRHMKDLSQQKGLRPLLYEMSPR